MNKGFLLLDSLVTVFICGLISVLCYSAYKADLNYEEGYLRYQEESNERLLEIFMGLNECEACTIDDESF